MLQKSYYPQATLITIIILSLLTACTRDEKSPSNEQSPGEEQLPGTTNTAPTISGTPNTSIETYTAYSFTPSATDADNDTLTFSITNKPSWASMNNNSGQLSGSPGSENIGTTENIVISVSDGQASNDLASFNLTVFEPQTLTITWQPPSSNIDGSDLTDLAGYKIYYGTVKGEYTSIIDIDNPDTTSRLIKGLMGPNTYYFVVTAYNIFGAESRYSTFISAKVD